MNNNSIYISPSLIKICKYASEYSTEHKSNIADFIILADNYDANKSYLLISIENCAAIKRVCSFFKIYEVLSNDYLKLYSLTSLDIENDFSKNILANILFSTILINKNRINCLVGRFNLEQEALLKQYDTPAILKLFTYENDRLKIFP